MSRNFLGPTSIVERRTLGKYRRVTLYVCFENSSTSSGRLGPRTGERWSKRGTRRRTQHRVDARIGGKQGTPVVRGRSLSLRR